MALSRITANSIEDGTVVAADIADGSITTAKIVNDAITSAKIADGNVTTSKIATGTITGDKIGVGQITANLFAAGAVSTTSISNGNSNVTIASANSDVSIFTSGNAAASFDSNQVFKFNSGFGSVATAYGCRAWVNFDGTTNVGGNCTIRASGNVSSIADGGTGTYTVNFTTAMPDANYCVATGPGNQGGNGNTFTVTSYLTTSVLVYSWDNGSTPIDNPDCNIAIFR